ncbi:MAG: chalcone isomerase family protein [Spirochaetales bacterium]|nr:chalcone isomerase family protein [Spirochaetales bacterium]
MVKRIILTSIMACFISTGIFALEIGGKSIPDTMDVQTTETFLNGAGIRLKTVFKVKVYIVALYLTEKTSDYEKILNADEPMALRLLITTNAIKSEEFMASTKEAFEESTGGNTAPIQAEIDQFISVFSGKLKKDDYFDIKYHPETGTQVFKNGSETPAVTMKGMAIKKALFGIWVGVRTDEELMRVRSELLKG